MAKMFVHYNGSVDNFKKINNYAKTYNNSIVFISGGENEEGAAIYTHGKFYANIKDVLDLAGQLAGLKIIKGIKVDGTERVAANHDGIIEFKAADNATVTVEGTSTGIKIGLEQAFVDRVTAAEGAIAKEVEDRGKEITRVEGVVSGINDRVTAIEGTANDPSSVNSIPGVKQYAVEKAEAAKSEAISDAEGKVNAAKAAVIGASGNASKADTIYGAKKYADEKAEAAQTAAEATAANDATSKANTAEQNAKNYADGLKNAIDAAYAKADAGTLAAAKGYADGLVMDGENPRFDSKGAASAAEQAAKTYADGLVKDAEGKSRFDAAGSAEAAKTAAVTAANQYTDGKVREINSVNEGLDRRVTANALAIEKLNGDGDGSVKSHVADEIAKIVNENANGSIDTLNEIAAWIVNDATGAASMANDIATLKGAATVEGSVANQVKVEAERALLAELGLSNTISNLDAAYKTADTELLGKITALEDVQDDYATKTELAAEAKRADEAEKANAAAIKVISDNYLKAADKEALQGAINTEKGRIDTIVADYLKAADKTELSKAVADEKTRAEGQEAAIRSEFAAADSTLQGNIDDLATAVTDGDAATLISAKSHVADEIAKLKFEDKLETDQFVTSVSETAGKISVTRSGISASQIKISNTEDDLFDVNTVTVQDALTELASFWAWEER